ncbi:MAG: rhamnulokinase [Lentisphaerae bacterium]|nr:rhamnulokinase [Lentisphaerota bacterium]
MKRLLAVDLGASGGKCFAGTFDGDTFAMDEIHRFAHEGVSVFIADRTGVPAERTVWDDVLIYDHIVRGLQAYRREVAESLDSIGIDTWGADGQFVSADGDLAGKVYCYRDHRLDGMIGEVKKRIDARRLYEITGIHFQPFNVSNQLLWFMQHRGDALRPGSVYLPVPTLFLYYLGGVKAVDSTWASVTQVMDARTKQWSGEILDALGVPRDVMPEIVAPGAAVGRLQQPLAEAVGLNRARLTAAPGHDTASAFAAAPAEDTARSLIISSGTWSLIGKLVPEPITSDAAMAANISNEGGIGNVRFLKNCMGSWLVQELRRGWRVADGRESSWEELNALTEKGRPFAAFIDPDDPGFYNPPDMEAAIAGYCRQTGQDVPQDRGTLLRLVYESLALKYRRVNEQICGASGTETAVVHVVGGGCRNVLLNRFTADALGLPVLAGPEEATAVGNLMVQAVGLGILPDLHAALPLIKQAFAIRTFTPRDTASWNEAYARFQERVGGGV